MTPKMKDWVLKNWATFVVALMIPMGLYSTSKYISSIVTDQLKNYLPIQIWNQWANERGEWRGTVDQRIENLEKEMNKQRAEIITMLGDIRIDVKYQGKVLEEHIKVQVPR